jgi:hypothetical protein
MMIFAFGGYIARLQEKDWRDSCKQQGTGSAAYSQQAQEQRLFKTIEIETLYVQNCFPKQNKIQTVNTKLSPRMHSRSIIKKSLETLFMYLLILAIQGFNFRALHLLGRCSTT